MIRQGKDHQQEALHQAELNSFDDLDEARRSFEQILDQHAPEFALRHLHVLTSSCRRRKQLEIQLLQSLEDSDEALEELIHLWIHEGAPEDANIILDMQEECSPGLVKEEALLKKMIRKHPSWCEPSLRLATLLFYKGRTEESFELAHRARELKPWHFEVYPLLIMLNLRGPNPSFQSAIGWARMGLPKLHGRRRHEWVMRAVEQAETQFETAKAISEQIMLRPQSELTAETFTWQ
ncbi:hypothetical protein MPSEU_001072600 [Mayamaea pseudoterrestris]|nr:hypothetical protein MPSEU_001072600 [Mayamaea pseudoterrestris]